MNELNSLQQSQQARRAAIAEWRKSRTHEETLPSGLPVVLRDATIMDLMVGGNIPQTLLDIIVKSAWWNRRLQARPMMTTSRSMS